ncbi:MAG: TldD/PmbA family protein [Candidatus Nanoarchaeia archaeon]|nr:TldD/PmbA family protein [Candidatus Nanoarchaeia archaeon]
MSEIKSKIEWEAIIQTARSHSISMDIKGIDTPVSNNITSITVRALADNRQGIITSNNINSLKTSIMQAHKLAKLSPKISNIPSISSIAKFSKKEFNYNYFNEKKLVESTEEIKSILDTKAPIIEFLAKKVKSKVIYVNYLGAKIELENDALGFELAIGKEHRLGTNSSMLIKKKPNLKEFAKTALFQYDCSKNLSKPKSGNYPVIFCHDAMLNIMSPIFFSLKGDSVCENKSRFINSINKQDLSKDLTIIDDCFEKNNKSFFDFEGNKSKKTVLVKNGIVKSFIHDNYTSEKLKMNNTNNSASMVIKPSTSFNCISIKGNDKLSQMIKSVKEGFIIYGTYPDHTINSTTGAFGQNSSTFYHIKNGEIQGLCKGYVVMGNSYESLKKPLEISKETRNDIGANIGAIKINAKILKN